MVNVSGQNSGLDVAVSQSWTCPNIHLLSEKWSSMQTSRILCNSVMLPEQVKARRIRSTVCSGEVWYSMVVVCCSSMSFQTKAKRVETGRLLQHKAWLFQQQYMCLPLLSEYLYRMP